VSRTFTDAESHRPFTWVDITLALGGSVVGGERNARKPFQRSVFGGIREVVLALTHPVLKPAVSPASQQ